MDISDLEKRIKELKGNVAMIKGAATSDGSKEMITLRTAVKQLKRTQRRKRTLLAREVFIKAKGLKKKKEGKEASR